MYETVPSYEKASCIYEYQYNCSAKYSEYCNKILCFKKSAAKEKARNRLDTNVVLNVKCNIFISA
jgi:hypothetical protein